MNQLHLANLPLWKFSSFLILLKLFCICLNDVNAQSPALSYESPKSYSLIQPQCKLSSNQYSFELIFSNDGQSPGEFTQMEIDSLGFIWLANNSFLGCYDGNKMLRYSNKNEKYPLSPEDMDLGFYDVFKTSSGQFMISHWAGMTAFAFDPYNRKITNKIEPDTIHNLGGFFGFSDDGRSFFSSLRSNVLQLKEFYKNGEEHIIFELKDEIDYFNLRTTQKYNWLCYHDKLSGFPLNSHDKEVEVNLDYLYQIGQNNDNLYLYDYEKNVINYWNDTKKKLEPYYELPDAIKSNVEKFLVVDDNIFIGNSRSYFVINTTNHTYQDYTLPLKNIIEELTPNNYGDALVDIYHVDSTTIYFLTNKSLIKLLKSSINDDQYLESHDHSELLNYRMLAEDEEDNIYASYYLGILRKQAGDKSFKSYLGPEDIQSSVKATYDLKYWKGHLIWNNALINLKDESVQFLGTDDYARHCNLLLENDSLWIFQWWAKGDMYIVDLNTGLSNAIKLKYLTTTGDSGRVEMINAMSFDNDGNIWAASRWRGLFHYTKKGRLIKHYDFEELGIYRIENGPTSLVHQDSLVWVGHHNGLLKLRIKDGDKQYFKFPDVDMDRLVNSIEALDNGILLCGTNKGLIKFDTKTQEYAYLNPKTSIGHVRFNRNSTYNASDGKVYFGSSSGLYSFRPNELDWKYPGEDIDSIYIDGLSYYDNREKKYIYFSKNLNPVEGIDLKSYHSNFSASLSLVSMDNPVFYSYRLEGVSQEWSPYSPEGIIRLFSIPAGQHKLQIRASYNKSTTNYTSRVLELNVAQVWYKRPWIILLISLVLAGAIIAIMRLRYLAKMKAAKDKEMLRVKISSDLHDDVGSILTGLAMQSELMAYQVKEKKDELMALSSQSRDAMERMRDTVWAIDSRKDHFYNLIDRMKEYSNRHFKNTHFKITFEFDKENMKEGINPDVRQNLYLIYKEALNNAVKYSDGDSIHVHLQKNEKAYSLKVHDNGSPQEQAPSDGLGMQNMKMRAGNIGCTFSSGYDKGFFVEIC